MRTLFSKGFSTLELMIAFALMSLVFSGVILAHFGAAYWSVASQTSNEGLYKAKTTIEQMRAVARRDFRLASSSPATKVQDQYCSAGGLCYYAATLVDDLSPCSKYVTARVDWQVSGYPTTTTSLFTNLTNATEAINLGGDCPLTAPAGAFAAVSASSTFPSVLAGNPQAIDALAGTVYAGTDAAPYLQILTGSGAVSFANSFALTDTVDAIDVARDLATGRTYAYLATASTTAQLAIVDVTDLRNPSLVSVMPLAGVSGAQAQGWRIAVYKQTAYLTVREHAGGPELHIIDVSTPSNPAEKGSLALGTSVYGMVVREQKVGSTLKRFVYAADALDSGEVKIIDVTTPAAPALLSTLNLPYTCGATSNEPDANAVFLAGNTLYVGREHASACAALPSLYSIDVSNPAAPAITSSAVANSVIGLETSGDLLFALTSTAPSPQVSNLVDLEGNAIYAGHNGTNAFSVWKLHDTLLPASASANFPLPAGKAFAIQSQ